MHELGLAQEVVETIAHKVNGARVNRVVIEVGALTGIFPDAFRFGFELSIPGTSLEGSRFDVIEEPGKARCLKCGGEMYLDSLDAMCSCGSTDLQCIAGDQLRVIEIEVEPPG